MVPVAHRECRRHEWEGKYQWRLSFSRAEIVLINSWMPEQQIVYHLLRVFLKTERLTVSADNSASGTLSNYHIKTLMLWACEMKPRSWWTNNFTFTAICADLLHLLAQWLNQGHCPHYFITGCNFLNYSERENQILAAERLSTVNEGYLIKWFLGSYLPTCCQRCPRNVAQLFDGITTRDKMITAVSAAVDWRRTNALNDTWNAFLNATGSLIGTISNESVTARSYLVWKKEMKKLDIKLCVLLMSITCLHVARNILSCGFTDLWTKLLSLLCDDLGWKKEAPELVEFLQKSATERLTTFRQFEVRDFGSVATIVTTDFEAMYAYKRGDYQRCLQLSTQNVRMLLYANGLTHVATYPEFIQLLDDDIVSLTALTLIVNPRCRAIDDNVYISQLTLSLYLMAQCQLKLRHSVTSLDQTLDYIKVAQRRFACTANWTLNRLTLELAVSKITIYTLECC